MNTESKVERVGPNELSEAKYRMMSIRFDCYAKMFDFGQKFTNTGWSFPSKPLSPQWFKSEIKLTMESVKYLDPYALGTLIKE